MASDRICLLGNWKTCLLAIVREWRDCTDIGVGRRGFGQPRNKILRHNGIGVEQNDILIVELFECSIDRANKSEVSGFVSNDTDGSSPNSIEVFGDTWVRRRIVDQNDAVMRSVSATADDRLSRHMRTDSKSA